MGVRVRDGVCVHRGVLRQPRAAHVRAGDASTDATADLANVTTSNMATLAATDMATVATANVAALATANMVNVDATDTSTDAPSDARAVQ